MAPGDDTGSMKQRELHGWKEIADYLNRSVRTAQRWEREFELPVRRLRTAAGETVYALSAELDEWKQNLTLKGNGSSGFEEAEADETAAPEAPATAAGASAGANATRAAGQFPAPRAAWRLLVSRRRVQVLAAGTGLVLVLSASAWWLLWQRGSSAEDDQATPWQSEGLDSGPWPTEGHDSRRSGQSHLAGPSRPAAPRLVYDAGSPLNFSPTGTGPDESAVVMTSRGELALGNCDGIVAVDLSGRLLWRHAHPQTPIRDGPTGLTVDGSGTVLVSTHECPPFDASRRTNVYAIGPGGDHLWAELVGETYRGPAVGREQRWYTISDTNLVRAFSLVVSRLVWMTDLAGYNHGSIALDGQENLYVGTDGGMFHQRSLWSIAPNGDIRWSAGTASFQTPVVTASGRLLVAGGNNLHCYDTGGGLRWTTEVGAVANSASPLAVGRSGTAYVRSVSGLTAVAENGTVKWQIRPRPGSTMRPGPVLDKDENVYTSFARDVCSFTPSGKKRWCVAVDDPGKMIVAADRVLCVVSQRQKVYAIEEIPSR